MRLIYSVRPLVRNSGQFYQIELTIITQILFIMNTTGRLIRNISDPNSTDSESVLPTSC